MFLDKLQLTMTVNRVNVAVTVTAPIPRVARKYPRALTTYNKIQVCTDFPLLIGATTWRDTNFILADEVI